MVNSIPKVKKLKDACCTHWIECIDAYIMFLELIPAVHMTLQAMTSPGEFSNLGDWNWDEETVTKANGFLYQLESSLFSVSFVILLEIFPSMRGLTCKLQMRAVNVLYAYKEVKKVIILSSFESMRKNSEHEFRIIFKRASKLG